MSFMEENILILKNMNTACYVTDRIQILGIQSMVMFQTAVLLILLYQMISSMPPFLEGFLIGVTVAFITILVAEFLEQEDKNDEL